MNIRRQTGSQCEQVSCAQWLALGVALLSSAILMAFAISSPTHWWLGWITLLPLLQSVRSLRPSLAAVAGSFWGAALFAASTASSRSSVDATPLAFALLTVVPGLYAGLGSALTRRIGFSPYLLALGWIGVEFCLRPVGLAHGLLAGTQGNGVLVYALGFSGYVIVAFLVAYINASLLDVLHEVRGCFAVLRVFVASSRGVQSIAAAETPYLGSRFSRLSQPRAPPA